MLVKSFLCLDIDLLFINVRAPISITPEPKVSAHSDLPCRHPASDEVQ